MQKKIFKKKNSLKIKIDRTHNFTHNKNFLKKRLNMFEFLTSSQSEIV